MAVTHQSKYPQIIVDEEAQAVNPDMEYHLTVEQYYDLLHHTHDSSSIIGGGSSGGDPVDFTEINQKISDLTDLVQQNSTSDAEIADAVRQNVESIAALTSLIQAQTESINNLTTAVNNLQATSDAHQDYIDNDMYISDMDTGENYGGLDNG